MRVDQFTKEHRIQNTVVLMNRGCIFSIILPNVINLTCKKLVMHFNKIEGRL